MKKRKTKIIDKSYDDIISDYQRQLDKSKIEYEKVTAYLSDIQKIDMFLEEDKQNLKDLARKVLSLTQIRKEFQESNEKANEYHFNIITRYQQDVAKDIIKINDCEEYQEMINRDLDLLLNEKKYLDNNINNTTLLRGYFKKLAITTYILVLVLFAAIIALKTRSKMQLNLPFYLTIIFAGVFGIYIVNGYKKTGKKIRQVHTKLRKIIALQNQVKIKSVNNLNLINFYYDKYKIGSSKELKIIWDDYVKTQDMLSSYKGNTKILNQYQDELLTILSKNNITYPEFWNYFPIALVNDKEMVEIRHGLNKKRQLAREEIETYITEIERLKKG